MAPATPELLALQDLCSRMERAAVPYMLTGSLAMAYYARHLLATPIDDAYLKHWAVRLGLVELLKEVRPA